ncbi:hypothetical protein EO98_04750 [Methanosarcina sp. 2.H.T.1A.6]|nr:hypothetical protein EO94_05190 [Methanosarcina sp. 2.H.T.1A.3]KKG21292.1 hypothetical protein EO98_04750 [Methanosarcina sp. 2.H.T.1A.6]KKG24140.1 hypothetical protein EO96_14175 [Methanosarcina sp. 2.H.T.1A.8]KKG28683.1 hypothetical protein EO97_14835 [Methanosarcina sp. 2.H.T.1A.15]
MAAPASISFKKKGGKKYQSSIICKAKAYLGFNRAGKLMINFTGCTHTEDIRIVVSKFYLLEMLKFNLAIRPIKKSKQDNLWVGKETLKKNGVVPFDLEGKSLDEIRDEYQIVRGLLEEFLPTTSEKDKEVAQKQFESLVETQLKIEVLSEIERSRKLLERMNPPRDTRKKEIVKQKLPSIEGLQIDEGLHYLSGTWTEKQKRKK